MRPSLIITAAFVLTATPSSAQFLYPGYAVPYDPAPPSYAPRRHHDGTLSRKCAMASDYIRKNNCGPKGCDEGLCVALAHGCRINSWGHVCSRRSNP